MPTNLATKARLNKDQIAWAAPDMAGRGYRSSGSRSSVFVMAVTVGRAGSASATYQSDPERAAR
jgi:hypothetical protein